ncbi:MAG: hypothetical protein JXB03_03095 [Spirochaetales bacterium]|nr:hypothetical protein [Spirochaetales bacterium]
MKRFFSFLVYMYFGISLWAFEGGVGVSVFIPETLYKYGEGTIAIEKTLSTSIGFGKYFSIPIGINYHHADGYTIASDSVSMVKGPVLYGDTLSAHLLLQTTVPLNPVYFKVYGGGAVNWAFVLRPYAGFFDKSLAGQDGDVALHTYTFTPSPGFGWMAGASIGIKMGQFSIDLGGTYRDIRHDLAFTAAGYEIDYDTGTVTAPLSVEDSDAHMILRGVSVALSVNVVF